MEIFITNILKQSKALVYVYIASTVCFSYLDRKIVRRRMSKPPPKKIPQLTLNAFITANSNNNRSRESDVPDQNVTSSVQSLLDFEIVRPAENEQGERSGSLPFTQSGRRFQPN